MSSSLPRFVGRAAELRTLAEAYAAPESGFVPVYGRRRVGKSELILRFLQEHPGVYFLGKQAPGALQLREFLGEAAVILGEPLLGTSTFDGWKSALAAVSERWTRREKLVLVFDEFQWTAWASPELPSVLQDLWDRRWRSSGRILLILCGSYVGFMEREVLGRKSPLFGRRTAQILLRPFGYREAALFHPAYSPVDRARAYFICGGVPWYLGRFDPRRSVEANVIGEVLSEHAPLRHEPEFLLREELREVESYFAVLLAIASGRVTPRDISAVTAIGERSLHYYLQQLVELGYVRRRYPLSDAPAAARHVRFVLDDALLRFWFRFVFPNTSYLAQMGPERTLRERIRPEPRRLPGKLFRGPVPRGPPPALWPRARRRAVRGRRVLGQALPDRCRGAASGWLDRPRGVSLGRHALRPSGARRPRDQGGPLSEPPQCHHRPADLHPRPRAPRTAPARRCSGALARSGGSLSPSSWWPRPRDRAGKVRPSADALLMVLLGCFGRIAAPANAGGRCPERRPVARRGERIGDD